MATDQAIEVSALRKIWRTRGRRPVAALDGLDLAVPRGSIFALLGPNGAGKTTLVKALLGLVRPSGGSARVFGVPVDDHRVRRRMGFLPEGQGYPEYPTGMEYSVMMGRLSGLSRAEAKARAASWLDRVGLGDAKDRKIRTYSKGMCQRCGLAAALLHGPDLILLDEPTDGVDPLGRKEIRDLILAERAAGRTVFLNSHLLSEVDQMADRVAILNRGRVLAAGEIDDVKRQALGGTSASTESMTTFLVVSAGGDLRPAVAGFEGTVLDAEHDGSRLRIRIPSASADATPLIDHLRKSDARIRAIEPVETSLEDRFIALIEDDNRRRAKGQS